jgi:glycosyltransferase involved in cell wall biosynthesis
MNIFKLSKGFTMKYVALTSGRNEEKFIRHTVEAVLALDPPLVAYVVVDDASTDTTPEILAKYEEIEVLRLENPRYETRGVNLAWALNSGMKRATKLVPDWGFILKIDADSVLPRDYFQRIIAEFEKNPRLGVSSGTPHDEMVWRGGASDGAKVYRRVSKRKIHPTQDMKEEHPEQMGSLREIKVLPRVPPWHTFLIAILYATDRPWIPGG